MLHAVRGRGQPVAQQVLEQQLAEPATRLRRAQRLLEPRQILGALQHLSGRLIDLPELLVNLVRRLGCVLEPAVDLRVELAESAIHRLGDPFEAPVDRRRALGELGAPVGPELTEGSSGEPHDRAGDRGHEDQGENGTSHRVDRR